MVGLADEQHGRFALPRTGTDPVGPDAREPEQRAERHWLLDVDDPSRIRVEALRRRIERIYEESEAPGAVTVIPTINGYHLVCSHGFDTRLLGDMLERVDVKRDALYLYDHARKEAS